MGPLLSGAHPGRFPFRFLVRRAAAALAVAAALSALCFALLDLAPGSPAASVLEARSGGRPPAPAAVERLEREMGLHDPLPVRYGRWAAGAVRGDFGVSYGTGRPVAETLAETVPWTALLTAVAVVLSVAGAVAVGLAAALTRRAWLRRGIETGLFALGGMPGFVTALLLLWVFAAWLRVLPSGGPVRPGEPVTPAAVIPHLVLPAVALAFGHHFGTYARLVQTGVERLRAAPHVENARARGLPRRTVVARHLLRPGMVPFTARLGVGVGGLIAGAYATEMIFSWPGVGRQAVLAAREQDYPVLTAVVLVTGAIVILANLLADLAVAWLDPRVRLAGRGSGDRSSPGGGAAHAGP
ncbi:ABC transporter permease [Actinomadura viridis]|uniref:ABC-type dipeptide/oligopeptide/nickel transport system permease component n=1 Tax=Actinomadura viridis TaxID=58110 RepID=A0A931GLM1_9ACTN|nr:ABC transporter permease [Actinomadura viridis]MBG6091667.1 ABC-type dipeptide/oligopeptide/nickel transport system permease component [Actinomadura viridis]